MNPQRYNRIVQRELMTLRREGVIDPEVHARLAARHPAGRWDWRALGRWFGLFGGLSFVAGVVILGTELFTFTLEKLAMVLAVLTASAFAGSVRLRARQLRWAPWSLELVGALLLIGLTFNLGFIFSNGSGNWPALVLVDLCVVLPLAYLFGNPLLLTLSMVLFFSWFGGVTGYLSGWGAYFFGMNYPLRFLMAGIAIAAIGILHRDRESGLLTRWEGFFKVWLGAGLFFAEMALWLLSLFGNFGSMFEHHRETAGELVLFNLLWAGGNGLLLALGHRFQLRQARGFALTFLVIQGYTLYFWHVAGHLGPVFGTFIAGLGALGLVLVLERSRRAAGACDAREIR